jgi:hypothetical protein
MWDFVFHIIGAKGWEGEQVATRHQFRAWIYQWIKYLLYVRFGPAGLNCGYNRQDCWSSYLLDSLLTYFPRKERFISYICLKNKCFCSPQDKILFNVSLLIAYETLVRHYLRFGTDSLAWAPMGTPHLRHSETWPKNWVCAYQGTNENWRSPSIRDTYSECNM